MKKILSIDGGGIRGVIPAMVLVEIEKRTGKKIAEMFDLIAGTSTGGVIALALTKLDDTNKIQYSASEIVDIYATNGKQIFAKKFGHSITSLGGIADEKYDKSGVEDVLSHYFGECLLDKCCVPTFVTSYDLEQRKPTFFKSWRVEYFGVKCREAARATSAAPTYFEPTKLDINGRKGSFIDGGVFVNNPAMSAYAEAKMLWPDEEIFVLSIGTGENTKKIKHTDAISWGGAEWILPVLDIMFDAQSDAVDYQMYNVLQDNYFRLQTKLCVASPEMDDVSEENIEALIQEAEKMLENQKTKVDVIVKKLTNS